MTYRLTTWAGDYVDRGDHATFSSALAAFVALGPVPWGQYLRDTRQIVNVERAEDGRDGLTDSERDQLAEVA